MLNWDDYESEDKEIKSSLEPKDLPEQERARKAIEDFDKKLGEEALE